MSDRKPVCDIIKAEIERADIETAYVADAVNIKRSTFWMKLKNNSFSAEEAIRVLEYLGMEVSIVPSKGIGKRVGGTGPRVRVMVNRTIYDTAKSYAICHTEWVDGWRMELFMDQENRFFVAHYTTWKDAANIISEIGKEDAAIMYTKYGDGAAFELFQ